MHRAVLNVITNALDAAAEIEGRGTVRVLSEYLDDGPTARIVVEDNGTGIPADQMETLFSPFVSTKGARGTGLGLPVSQKILGEHGGQIRVDSEQGRGARFVLDLPAVLPKSLTPATAH